MIVELCIILRIVLNESEHNAFQGATIETCKANKDVSNVELTPTSKMTNEDSLDMNTGMKSLWIYRPPQIQSQQSDEQQGHNVVLRPPHVVTRLAKPMTYGFDPFFNKEYFEPFERRQKPVSLITFRKNGVQPRKLAIQSVQDESAEVAEMQSAFNDLSNLWNDGSDYIRNI